MRFFQSTCAALLIGGLFNLSAEPPTLDIPAEVKPAGGYARFTPKGTAVAVTYVGLSGVDAFPSEELKDGKRFLLPVAGMKPGRYKFAAVGASDTKPIEQTRVDFWVVIPGETIDPPVVDPNPPKDPPVTPTTALYFLVVRQDGPALPAFTQTMSLPEWSGLKAKGHSFKDKTITEAKSLGINVPAGTTLPTVAILRERADLKKSELLKFVPLPSDASGVSALPDAVK